MTFDAIERSIASAQPVELYDLVAPIQSWHLTSFESDTIYLGTTYVATTGARSSLTVPDFSGDQGDFVVQLPANHAAVQAYVNGIPMRDLLVTLTRYYPAFGFALQFGQGYASGLTFAGREASFRVPQGTNDALALDVPSVVARRLCNNVLYDGQCTVVRTSFQLATTIASISADGRTFGTVGSVPSVPNTQAAWAIHGELVHTASQERRTIIDQTGLSSFLLQAGLPNSAVHVGDAVTIFAGCDHFVSTCDTKFSNGVNYGGHPYMLPSNIFYTNLRTARMR